MLPTDVSILTSNDEADAHCNWNSDYWRELGTPWGGVSTRRDPLPQPELLKGVISDRDTACVLQLLTTAADYSHLLQSFLYGGACLSGPGARILKAETARTMTAVDHTSRMKGMSAAASAEQAYGIGWRRNQGSLSRTAPGMWGGHGTGEEDGSGKRWEAGVVFGHGGATGATAFADPVSGISCVLLTTDPSLGESVSTLAILNLA